MTGLKKLAHEGAVAPLQAWLAEQDKRPAVNDLLWCALWTGDEACRRLLVDVATEKKITPKKKGWPWNDAIAAAIVGDVAGIAKAEKRNADFEGVSVAGTALMTAVRLRHVDFVRALLDKGVEANKPVKMARMKKISVFGGNMMMTQATPLGVALRDGCEETAAVLMEHVAVEPIHLDDAVQGANEALVRRVIGALGKLTATPKLFWSVHDPSVLPVLAEHGFDLSALPDDTGTWGGPIWSWWAYDLRGETRLDAFEKLFATGVRATAAGLGAVLGANVRGIDSPEMVELFLANGADLSDDVSWEGEDWDEENDCQVVETGSVAEKRLPEADLEMVQLLHAKGAAIKPLRPDPTWSQADEKKQWLERLGLVKSISHTDFPWLDAPSADEIHSFLATDAGLFGLRLGVSRDELAKEWDVARAEEGDGLFMDFDDEGCLRQVSREWRDLPSDSSSALEEGLVAALGKPKGGNKEKRWPVEGGHVTLREDWNDYYHEIAIAMQADD